MATIKGTQVPVSVVTPCYRCADTIGRAVRSIAAQTRLPAEVILVDDASPDNTLETLHALQRDYPDGWIKVVSLAVNQGPCAARNRGWDMATGDYVAFLDSDDSWHPEKNEIQYRWMERHPDVALSGTGWAIRPIEAKPMSSKIVATKLRTARLLLHNCLCTSGVMVRRDVSRRFDERKKRSEDYLLWLQISKSGRFVARIRHPLAFYHKSSFGESGLSSDIWKMQAGQVDTYLRFWREGSISVVTCFSLIVWSMVKFARRVGVVVARRVTGMGNE